MTTTTHRTTHTSNGLYPKKLSRLVFKKALRPLKKANKNINLFVTRKPYQTAGIATLCVGIAIGILFAKRKFF